MASRTVELIFQNTVRNGGDVRALSVDANLAVDANRRFEEQVQKTQARVSQLAIELGAMYVVGKATLGELSRLLADASGEKLLTTVRAVRLALSPTLFTASSVALGLFAEESLRAAAAQGKLLQQSDLAAFKTKQQTDEVYKLQLAARALGVSYDVLASSVQKAGSLEALRNLSASTNQITNPTERIQALSSTLGPDLAEKFSGIAGRDFEGVLRNLETFNVLVGSPQTQADLKEFSQLLRDLAAIPKSIATEFRLAAIEIQAFLALIATKSFNVSKTLGSVQSLDVAPGFDPGRAPNVIEPGLARFFGGGDLSRTERRSLQQTISGLNSNLGPAGISAEQLIADRNARRNAADAQKAAADAAKLAGEFTAQVDQILSSVRKQGLDPLLLLLAEESDKLKSIAKFSSVAGFAASVKEIRAAFDDQLRSLEEQKIGETIGSTAVGRGRVRFGLQVGLSAFGGGSLADGRFAGGTFVSRESDRQGSLGLDRGAFLEPFQKAQKADQERVAGIQRELGFTERILSLRSNERLVSNDLYNARTAAAFREFQITGDLVQLRRTADEASKQRALEILEVKQREKDQARENAGRAFDAVIAGGAGIRGFVTSQALGIGRTISQNLGGEVGNVRLSVPGQGTADNPNLLGRLLKGTPLGLDPAKGLADATAQNTTATSLNSAEIAKLSALLGGLNGGTNLGGAAAASGLLSSIPGASSASGILSLFTGRGGVSGPTSSQLSQSRDEFGALVQGVLNPSASSGSATLDAIQNQQRASKALALNGIGVTPRAGQSSTLNAIGAAGIAAGATFGVVNGIKQGGPQGTLTAAGSALGGAAGILTALGVTSSAIPILGVAALGAGLVASLIGDPKKRRDKELNGLLERSVFDGAVSQTFDVDTFGRAIDSNTRGETRIIRQEITINALDARSIMDRHEDISAAAAAGLERPGPLRESVRGLMEQ